MATQVITAQNANKVASPPAEQVEYIPNDALGHAADQEDHDLGVWASVRKYPWACGWCIYAIWCVILLSFDVQAAGAVVGIPQFRKDFGHPYGDGTKYVLPVKWQSAFNAAPVASATIASLIAGDFADRFGRRLVLGGALILTFIAVAVEFIATTCPVFFAGKFINGFMVGTIGTVMIGYIGEITPLALRGVFTCGVGVSYGIGPLVAFIIINYTGKVTNPWAYRTVFCCQFGFAGVAAICLPFMPESPWWLASKGRTDSALRNLAKLGHTGDEGRKKLALIELTLKEARKESEGATYMECFRKNNIRRTIISIMPYNIATFSGISFVAGYFTYYLQLAGYSTSQSYRLQLAQPVVSIVGNVMAAMLVDRVGRRKLTIYGLAALTTVLLITGGLGTSKSKPVVTTTVAFILIFSWLYNLTIGSMAFTLLCEVSTSRLRVKTIAIGYATHAAFNVMWQFTIPYMFNPDQANLGAKIAFIFGGLSFVSIIYFWFFQPETSGRSYQELDELFAKGISSRKFKGYKTDVQMQNEAAANDKLEM